MGAGGQGVEEVGWGEEGGGAAGWEGPAREKGEYLLTG